MRFFLFYVLSTKNKKIFNLCVLSGFAVNYNFEPQ